MRLVVKMSKSVARIKTCKITARVTPIEKTFLEQKAATFGISMGELCLQIIINKNTPKSQTDLNAISELTLTRANLGRIGGLLKAWMGGEYFPQAHRPLSNFHVVDLLHKIEDSQSYAVEVIKKITGKKS